MNGPPAIAQRKLRPEDFEKIRHFSLVEVTTHCQDGAWGFIDAGSLFLLDQFAGYLINGHRLIESVQFMPTVTSAGVSTATWNAPDTRAHAPNSMHYEGRAFDVMFPKNKLATAWLTAMRFPKWGGVGAYPFWHVGGKREGGLHLDTRLSSDVEQGRGFRVFWWVSQDGVYHYLNDGDDVLSFLAALGSTP